VLLHLVVGEKARGCRLHREEKKKTAITPRRTKKGSREKQNQEEKRDIFPTKEKRAVVNRKKKTRRLKTSLKEEREKEKGKDCLGKIRKKKPPSLSLREKDLMAK